MACARMRGQPEGYVVSSKLSRIEIPASKGVFSCLAGGPPLGQAPLIHLAHATGMNAQTYAPLLERLAARYTVRAVDLRGHGLTTVPAEPSRLRSWERYVHDLVPILEQWGQPAILVGHSMGGAVSGELAAVHPSLAAGLLMIDPAVAPRAAVPALAIARATGFNRRFPIAEQAAKRRAVWPSREMLIAGYRGRGAFKTWGPGFLENYIDGGIRPAADGAVELTCAPAWEAKTFSTISLMFWRRISRLRCPVSVLYAEHHSTLRDEGARTLRKLHPAATLEKVPGSSHFIPMESPDLVIAAIDALAARAKAQKAA